MSKHIVIVGGGIAGYLTALKAKKYYSAAAVTVISSDKIGILGAGEGTTPTFLQTIVNCDVPIDRVFKETDANFKLAVAFKGWSRKEDVYFHTFDELVCSNSLDKYMQPKNWCPSHSHGYVFSNIFDKNKLPPTFQTEQCLLTRAPLEFNKDRGLIDHDHNASALHYDVGKMVKLLKDVAREKYINIIDSTLTDVKINTTGKVTDVVLDGGHTIPCDFVFDCTGFRRTVISKVADKISKPLKFINTNNTLPVDSAIAYRMSHVGSSGNGPGPAKLRPYTIARTLEHGWEWTISVWSDLRKGYIYSSQSCTDEQAHEEVCELYGKNIDVINKFKFDSGYLHDYWVNNCAAIGLAGGFFEPLEATANNQISAQVDFVLHNMFTDDTKHIENTNRAWREGMDTIHDFLVVHYTGCKSYDTNMWNHIRECEEIRDITHKYIDRLRTSLYTDSNQTNMTDDQWKMFDDQRWLYVLGGTKQIPKTTDWLNFKSLQNEIFWNEVNELGPGIKQFTSKLLDNTNACNLLRTGDPTRKYSYY